MTKKALIIGAHSTIGQAFANALLAQSYEIIGVSRQPASPAEISFSEWYPCDNNDEAIKGVIDTLVEQTEVIDKVLICNGILHTSSISPEKRLEQLNAETLHSIFEVNTIVPSLWVSALLPLLKKQTECKLAVISARVGSISDNGTGGWYSYRASKAALNMLIKTASIEYGRRAPTVKLIAFHPGTTDTPLSKPFQARVKPEKLFTPEFVANRLIEIMNEAPVDQTVSYLDWDNKPIAW